MPETGVSGSWLPQDQQYKAELRYRAGELHSQASDLSVVWSPNLHTGLLVKQALRTISAEAFRCLESQIGTSIIPMKFLIMLSTKIIL